MRSLVRALRIRARREEGVSLIELLIAITITGIIMGPIGFAFYFGLRSTSDTQTRLIESNKASVLASYFGPDVQNAVTVARNATESTAACGAGAQSVLLLLTTDAGGTSSVSYYRGTGANTRRLYRRTCSGGAPTSLARVIDNLAATPPAPLQPVAFTCFPAACPVAWESVTVNVTQADNAGKSLYHSTLQATRRIS